MCFSVYNACSLVHAQLNLHWLCGKQQNDINQFQNGFIGRALKPNSSKYVEYHEYIDFSLGFFYILNVTWESLVMQYEVVSNNLLLISLKWQTKKRKPKQIKAKIHCWNPQKHTELFVWKRLTWNRPVINRCQPSNHQKLIHFPTLNSVLRRFHQFSSSNLCDFCIILAYYVLFSPLVRSYLCVRPDKFASV